MQEEKDVDLREKAESLMLKNYSLTGNQYIAPDNFHKDQWLWDSCFHAIVCAKLGLTELAKNEIERLLRWQKEDGWIPHQIYTAGKIRRLDIERWLYKKEHNRFHSSITHPPVIAQAVETIGDPEWIQKILPRLSKFYLYFAKKRDPDNDGLISVCLPTETGRDTSPDFNFAEPFSVMKHFFLLFKLERRYRKLDWDMEKIWRKNLFNVEDVMFNCIWIDGLRSLYRLIMAYGCEGMEPAEIIKTLADHSEKALYGLCWDDKDKIFYNLDAENKKIKRLTIGNLFPLILDNIPEEMRQGLVERHLTNPNEFWTSYPLPSVAADSPAFNPNSGYYCNWRGPVWINMNWFIVRGLIKHGYQDIARIIIDKTLQMAEKEGFREFYNPLSGKGLRRLTQGFGWSTLAIAFPKILENQKTRID